MWSRLLSLLCLSLVLVPPAPLPAQEKLSAPGRWSAERAQKWYAAQPWLVGCNFIPSTAVNQLEMWQADSFDPTTIDRELGLAADLGFNTVRVYLHDLGYEADPAGFKKRVDQFLTIAARHKIRPLFVFFDDCWNPEPKVGKQPAAKAGVHNSGWVRSPGPKVVNDPARWGRLQTYVTDVVRTFAADDRVLAWDLYNEPGNEGQGDRSLPLLAQTFVWARSAHPRQPLTAGVWRYDPVFETLNAYQRAASDIVSFHHYGKADDLRRLIGDLKRDGRPLLCTEYMARTNGSLFTTNLPVLHEAKIAAYNWGLVSGKTQTIYPWGSPGGGPEPKVWFHDIFRPDGTPYDPQEVALIRRLTGAAKKADAMP